MTLKSQCQFTQLLTKWLISGLISIKKTRSHYRLQDKTKLLEDITLKLKILKTQQNTIQHYCKMLKSKSLTDNRIGYTKQMYLITHGLKHIPA